MALRFFALFLAAGAVTGLTGCARWQPQRTPGPVVLDRACPLARAPRVTDVGPAGVRAAYHFVTQGATGDELGGLIRRTDTAGFRLALLTVQINGADTVFAAGPGVLRDQRAVDEEFRTACRLGAGRIYLTHVRYNPATRDGPVRVR